MYQKAHKLVGAARYSGAVRIAAIADKMQKYVPKLYDEKELKRNPKLVQPIPNFPPYKALHNLLLREV
jgi:HPt (histidine-containing phosphotransfer) domain-containing protein